LCHKQKTKDPQEFSARVLCLIFHPIFVWCYAVQSKEPKRRKNKPEKPENKKKQINQKKKQKNKKKIDSDVLE